MIGHAKRRAFLDLSAADGENRRRRVGLLLRLARDAGDRNILEPGGLHRETCVHGRGTSRPHDGARKLLGREADRGDPDQIGALWDLTQTIASVGSRPPARNRGSIGQDHPHDGAAQWLAAVGVGHAAGERPGLCLSRMESRECQNGRQQGLPKRVRHTEYLGQMGTADRERCGREWLNIRRRAREVSRIPRGIVQADTRGTSTWLRRVSRRTCSITSRCRRRVSVGGQSRYSTRRSL